MEWRRAIASEAAVLMRLVALLRAVADLTELVAECSPAVRGFVLWLMRRAETVARDFVTGEDPAALAIDLAGNGPEDAMRLAASLRALAWELEAQVRMFVAAGGGGGRDSAAQIPGRAKQLRRPSTGLSALASTAAHPRHLAHVPDTS